MISLKAATGRMVWLSFSSFGAATHAVIAMILDRNSAAIPRGLIQARNVLANLGHSVIVGILLSLVAFVVRLLWMWVFYLINKKRGNDA